jgi:hypothetical protein
MVAKTFIMTKEIRAMRAKSLRANKILRDHAATPAKAAATRASSRKWGDAQGGIGHNDGL